MTAVVVVVVVAETVAKMATRTSQVEAVAASHTELVQESLPVTIQPHAERPLSHLLLLELALAEVLEEETVLVKLESSLTNRCIGTEALAEV